MVDGTIRNFCSYECVLTYRVALFDMLDSKSRLLFPRVFDVTVNFPLSFNRNLARAQIQTW